MKKNRLLITVLALLATLLLIVFVYETSKEKEKTTVKEKKLIKTSLRLGWIPSASFAGEYCGQVKFASKYNLDLKCVPGGPGQNSIQMVVSGENDFGTIAADEVIAANEKGADLVIIGVINYYSPGAFASLKEKNIIKPKDFEGKKVGILPFGSTTLLYETLLKVNNVDRSKITEITVSPDLKPFINGAYDVQPVFVYDEPVTLDMQGIKYNIIEPKDFGVKIKGPVYFCKKSLLDNEPEKVKAFIYTVADGWNFALKNKEEAIKILKKQAPEINTKREALVLNKLVPYYSAYNNQPLNSDYESWNETFRILKEAGKIKNNVDLHSVIKLENINKYYKKNDN